MLDTIKSYLVNIGYKVDEQSFNKLVEQLKSLDSVVAKSSESTSASFVKASGLTVTAFAGIGIAITSLMDKLAQADLGYQKYAMHMYMATDQAKKLKIATDAMGESLQDIAWMPELRERYFDLLKEQNKMALPQQYENTMRSIRDIRYEFTRFKVEMSYGLQWIGYNIGKHIDFSKVKSWLASVNEYIVEHLPEWSEKVGNFFARIGGVASRLWDTIKGLFAELKSFWDDLPNQSKSIIATFGTIGAALLAGPIGYIAVAIGLLDDFFGYLDGSKHSLVLAPFWAGIIMAFDSLSRIIVTMAVATDHAINSIERLAVSTAAFIEIKKGTPGAKEALQKWLSAHPAGKSLSEDIKDVWDSSINEGLTGVRKGDQPVDFVQSMNDLINNKQTDAFTQGSGNTSFINRVMSSIASVETGGESDPYNAIGKFIERPGGKKDVALGKYQIMKSNWPEWSKGAGLGDNARPTPENQDIVAAWRIKYLAGIYNNDASKIAMAWNGGEGYKESNPDIASYRDKFNKAYTSQNTTNNTQNVTLPAINIYMNNSANASANEIGDIFSSKLKDNLKNSFLMKSLEGLNQ